MMPTLIHISGITIYVRDMCIDFIGKLSIHALIHPLELF